MAESHLSVCFWCVSLLRFYSRAVKADAVPNTAPVYCMTQQFIESRISLSDPKFTKTDVGNVVWRQALEENGLTSHPDGALLTDVRGRSLSVRRRSSGVRGETASGASHSIEVRPQPLFLLASEPVLYKGMPKS